MKRKMEIVLFGGIIVDQFVVVDRMPERGGDTWIRDSFHRVGGCAMNVGVTLSNLGLRPHIVSNVGDDVWGGHIRDELERRRFSTRAIRYAKQQNSGYCLTVVEKGGERTFLTRKGCEAYFAPDFIDEELIARTSHVYVTGYYLLEPTVADAICARLEDLKKAGAVIVFDPGPLVSSMEEETLRRLLRLSDLILPNEREWSALAEKLGWPVGDESRLFHETGVQTLILKQGDRGVAIKVDGAFMHVPPYRVDVVDTTGAGDSFAGGLIFGLSQGYGLTDSVRIASACGALTSTFPGPHGEFNMDQITELMRKAR